MTPNAAAIIVELPEHQEILATLIGRLPELRTVLVIGAATEELRAAVDAADGVELVDFGGWSR